MPDDTVNANSAPSPDRIGTLVRSVAPLVGLLALLGLAVRQANSDLTNDDTFFHLRFGSEFLNGWSLRDPGSVTTFGTRDWVPTQWLSQMGMAAAENLGGAPAVVWLSGLLFVAYALMLYLACRQQASPLVAALMAVAAFGASGQGISARPQVISYILVVLFTAAWLRTWRDGRIRWWLVPATWLWAMLHGMWIAGVVICVVGAIGCVLDRRPGLASKREGGLALAVPVLSLGVVALTPVGPTLLREAFVVGSRGEYFAEWGATEFTEPHPLALSTVLACVILVWVRRGGTSWTHALLLLVAGGWALFSMRTVPIAAAMAAPVAAAAFAGLVPAASLSRSRERLVAFGGAAVALVILALLAPGLDRPGPGHPDWEAEALDALPAGTPVLNDWQWGGYLMWRHPDLNFVMNGYGDIFTTDELERNVDILTLRAGWDEKVAETEAEYALVEPDSRLAYGLVEHEGWAVVQESDEVQLLRAPGAG